MVLSTGMLVVAGPLVRDWTTAHHAQTPQTSTNEAGQARQLLQDIPARGRAPKTGYRRDLYGHGWPTVAGCGMRDRILSRDLVDVVYRPGTRDCVVESGTLHDPYTGKTIHFVKGNTTSTLVQVDHVYPLALSWQQGAQQWNRSQREQFYADPANLVAVDGRTNQAKGASGPGSWLPPNKLIRCQYVTDFVTVASRYELSMNPGDHQAAESVLRRC
ncbi:MAG: HNH endonuclease family protein [Microlunatus sp.]|nr:HNH endonuclease family protein [Microlunatus sp.]